MLRTTWYNILLTFRERTLIFWTLAFPIILGCLFKFALGGIDDSYTFEAIPVAIVEIEKTDSDFNFTDILDEVKGNLIIPRYIDKKTEAETLLSDGKVYGIYILDGEDISLLVSDSNLKSSILNMLLDTYEQQKAIITQITDDKKEKLESDIQDAVKNGAYMDIDKLKKDFENNINDIIDSSNINDRVFVKNVSLGGRDVNSVTPYFYALMAMSCLYACFLGEAVTKRIQANISPIGVRVSLSPIHRFKLILSNGIGAYAVSLFNILIILVVFAGIFNSIDISYHPLYAVFTCIMGCLIGVSFGIFIHSIGKWSAAIKGAILLGTSMTCSFLSGLMVSNMKDIIEKNIPILNKINPAALIADSFYCICVYEDMDRVRINFLYMGIISIVFLIAAWLLTRRVSYDSI